MRRDRDRERLGRRTAKNLDDYESPAVLVRQVHGSEDRSRNEQKHAKSAKKDEECPAEGIFNAKMQRREGRKGKRQLVRQAGASRYGGRGWNANRQTNWALIRTEEVQAFGVSFGCARFGPFGEYRSGKLIAGMAGGADG